MTSVNEHLQTAKRWYQWQELRDLDYPPYTEYILPKLNRVHKLWELPAKNPSQFEEELKKICEEIRQKIHELGKSTDNTAPKVSIIIPAHNEENLILAVLLSIADQQYPGSIEVIVVDNNSDPSDRTAEIAQSCGAVTISYTLERSDPNSKGSQIALARQKGLQKASGAIIISTDADAVFGPYFVSALTQPLNNQQIAVVTGKVNNYGRAGQPYLYGYDASVNLGRKRLTKILNRLRTRSDIDATTGDSIVIKKRLASTAGGATAARKTDIKTVGGYSLNRYPGEDTELGFLLSGIGNIEFVDNPETTVWVSPRRLKQLYEEFKSLSQAKKIKFILMRVLSGEDWMKKLYMESASQPKVVR